MLPSPGRHVATLFLSNRWDSPMFTVLPEGVPQYGSIYDALYLSKPPPPNQSTQTQPLSSTNFLYELDRITQVSQ